ncbi:MAG: DUF2141 domain-containing protein [Pseudomonadota bacterium]|nr:DUF2141 domain-containing protein [Pseudomonadota bacterium]
MPGATATSDLSIDITGLRSARGSLQLCLTADPAHFPSCAGDADAVTRTVPATGHEIRIPALPYGDYGIAVIHDENDNHKLDTILGVPREGFGFSRNPPIGFGAPRFSAVRFAIEGDAAAQQVRMRYLL